MTYLHCPSCGKRIVIDAVGDFTVRWSTQKCTKCGAQLSIRYDLETTFVRYTKKTAKLKRKIPTVA